MERRIHRSTYYTMGNGVKALKKMEIYFNWIPYIWTHLTPLPLQGKEMEFRLELISLLISPFFFFSFFDKYTHLFFITCFEGESSPPPPPIKQRQHYFSRCHKNNIFRHCNRNYGSMSKKEKKIAHIHINIYLCFCICTYAYKYACMYIIHEDTWNNNFGVKNTTPEREAGWINM